MDIIKLDSRGFASNTYILVSGQDAAVVDPSAPLSEIKASLGSLKLRYILLTHGHFDHILTLDSLRASYKCEVLIHENDAKMLTDPSINASEVFGMEFASLGADEVISDGDIISLGKEKIKVISTPGHTPGSVCYDCGSDIICGDTLFSTGYGRYDLPGGDPRVLFNSLSLLSRINYNPMIHPGHGASVHLNDADIIRTIRNNNF